jgi:sigma-54 specific flagellar transcriptional regulator A
VRELSNLVARFNALWPESEIDISTIPRSMLPPGMRSSLSIGDDDSANIALNDNQSEVEAIIGLAQGWQSDNGERDGEIEMRQILQDVESKLISAALEDSDGNVSAAAKRLNMQRTTLIQRIAKLGLRD